ncbi:hypothetical protein PPYR_09428 [Photinus pyralis]|uniref:Uncharacterized protein n=1 Tax=Photinus pyralis TaxID=7054 RepID=A0A5N4AM53_PHOPY|nr:uncharacterized protein LOC116170207 [Photinus pyralis]KAB0798435.1 hypothetical protein PPYR_09428 [Photinus pyralis]
MADFNKEKRKLIYCISQWTPDSNVQEFDIDVSDLTVLFQIMGYTLEEFERVPAIEENGESASSTGQLSTSRVQLICSKSGMKSTLTRTLKSCQCPNTQDLDKGQSWFVTGCAPSSSQSTISSSACSLIPTISKCKASIVGHLIDKAISAIKDKDTRDTETTLNLSQNALLSRHRSLDTLKAKEGSKLFSGNLSKDLSWEVDPRTSPPTQASSPSPLPDLTRTLSGLSLDASKRATLIRHLSTVQELVNEALEIAGPSSTSIKKTQKRRVSDIKPEPSTPRKKATPNRRLLSLATKHCGIPTPTFQKVVPRIASTSKYAVGVKSKFNVSSTVSAKPTGISSLYRTASKPATTASTVAKCKNPVFGKK